MESPTRGKLVIISGPSGVGKTTLLGEVMGTSSLPLVFSVSATTRRPRPDERDGVNYYFLTDEEFQRRRRQGEFIECFEVFGTGHWYGTLLSEVTPSLEAGKWVVLEIDVDGAQAARDKHPDAVTIFIRPGSLEQLERQLRGRGTESAAAIKRRLEVAREELSFADRYQYQVVNDRVDRAAAEITDILNQAGD